MKIKKKLPQLVKDLSIDAAASAVGVKVGFLVGGVPGALAGAIINPVISDIGKRLLSKKEKTRMEIVVSLAKKIIKEKIEKGAKPIPDKDIKSLQELSEGVLLTARQSYEEKKLPLLASLVATAPFTSTPEGNMVQTLIYAEQLSYRELCVLAVIGWNEWEKPSKLSNQSLYSLKEKKSLPDEKTQGIYEDINHLLVLGIIGQVFDKETGGPAVASGSLFITPASLVLLYPGKLLFNGMQLDDVIEEDFSEIVEVLK